MKFKAGIYGEDKTLNRDVLALLKDNKSIEAVIMDEDCLEKMIDTDHLDFVYCTCEPKTDRYARNISRFVNAGISVVAFHGNPGRKIPVVKLDHSSDVFENCDWKSRVSGRKYCIMGTAEGDNSPQLLIDLSEISIRRFHLTQKQTSYYQ